MLADVTKWVVLAVLLAGLAMGVNALVPPLSGHLAMGAAAVVLFVMLYAAQSLGVEPLQ